MTICIIALFQHILYPIIVANQLKFHFSLVVHTGPRLCEPCRFQVYFNPYIFRAIPKSPVEVSSTQHISFEDKLYNLIPAQCSQEYPENIPILLQRMCSTYQIIGLASNELFPNRGYSTTKLSGKGFIMIFLRSARFFQQFREYVCLW